MGTRKKRRKRRPKNPSRDLDWFAGSSGWGYVCIVSAPLVGFRHLVYATPNHGPEIDVREWWPCCRSAIPEGVTGLFPEASPGPEPCPLCELSIEYADTVSACRLGYTSYLAVLARLRSPGAEPARVQRLKLWEYGTAVANQLRRLRPLTPLQTRFTIWRRKDAGRGYAVEPYPGPPMVIADKLHDIYDDCVRQDVLSSAARPPSQEEMVERIWNHAHYCYAGAFIDFAEKQREKAYRENGGAELDKKIEQVLATRAKPTNAEPP